mmetsp:Transcript_22624/g.32823  ORF Transcript_22624/g.32823 Transcript_22624/m.32823 type:complete len:313 (-) Transcript_22624:27-965(-)
MEKCRQARHSPGECGFLCSPPLRRYPVAVASPAHFTYLVFGGHFTCSPHLQGERWVDLEPAVAAPVQDVYAAVPRIPNLLELVDRPPVVSHEEEAHEQAVAHEDVVVVAAGAVHLRLQVLQERAQAVVHVRPGLPAGEAVEEPPKPLPLVLNALHLGLALLEVSKVLLTDAGLLPGLVHGGVHLPHQGLPGLHRPGVRRHVEQDTLASNNVLQLPAQPLGLLHAVLREGDHVVRDVGVHGLVHVALGLPVSHQDDAPWVQVALDVVVLLNALRQVEEVASTSPEVPVLQVLLPRPRPRQVHVLAPAAPSGGR